MKVVKRVQSARSDQGVRCARWLCGWIAAGLGVTNVFSVVVADADVKSIPHRGSPPMFLSTSRRIARCARPCARSCDIRRHFTNQSSRRDVSILSVLAP